MELDKALEALNKKFGLFHVIVFAILAIPCMFQALLYIGYVFTAMRSEFRCLIPECEGAGLPDAPPDMSPPWLSFAVPEPSKNLEAGCWRFVPNTEAEGTCVPGAFSNITQPCERRVYPNEDLSIMTEWDIACYGGSEYQLTMVGTLNSAGRMLGLPLMGYFSDRFGRRNALLVEMTVSAVLGMSRSFATSYPVFVSLEFLDPIFYDGIGGAAFIMGMELVPTSLRGLWSAVGHGLYALGQAMLGALAWAVPYWRWLLRILYAAVLLTIPLIWFLPESMRWLATKGRTKDVQKIIKRAAKMNNLDCEEFNFDKVQLSSSRGHTQQAASDGNSFSQELRETLRSRVLVCRLFCCCLCWVMVMFVYDGLAIYSVTMSGNPYFNFILVVLTEIPGAVITLLIVNRAGRRLSHSMPLIFTALVCFSYHFLPTGNPWYRVSAVMLAKLSVTISFTVLYVITAELFPTKVRHFMYSFCSTLGRVGSMVSPQAPLLSRFLDSLPMIVFGIALLLHAASALCLPETARARLPDCVSEAETIGKKPPAQPAQPAPN